MATTAQYTAQPIVEQAQVSAANTNRDGTGTLVDVCIAPNTAPGAGVGKRIQRVTLSRAGTTAAAVVTFFYTTDGGVTNNLICEVAVAAYTASNTAAQVEVYVPQLVGFTLPGDNTGNTKIRAAVTIAVASPINITVESGLL
jgi:hypothetical protein